MNPARRIGLTGCLTFVVLSVCASEAQAQVGMGRNFGLGLAVGYPDVGLSANLHQGRRSVQLVGALYFNDFSNRGALFLRGDYLFYPAVLARGGGADLMFYVGPGLGLGLGLGSARGLLLGLELPIGLSVQLRRAPIDVALEAVPRVFVVNGGRNLVDAGGTLHVRYYF